MIIYSFFLERQMFTHFLRIMQQTTATYVNVQLLQTLNILFENLRNETSLCMPTFMSFTNHLDFLLSNNHVNSIITHGFDFANDEITAYYISFLKTLSFKLNAKTIHFFFNEVCARANQRIELINNFNFLMLRGYILIFAR